MTAVNQDVSAYAGDTCIMKFTVVDNDGARLDVSSGTFKYTLNSLTPIEKENADMDLTDAATGDVTVTLSVADTDGITPGAYDHGLQMTLSGKTQHVSTGTFTVLTEIVD